MTTSDLTRELRAARPDAPDALRDRVRTIVTSPPAPRPAFGARLAALRPRLPERRTLLVLVPAAAVAFAVAGGVIGLVRPDRAPDATVAAERPDASPATDRLGQQGTTATSEAYGATVAGAPPASAKAAGAGGRAGATDSTLPSPATDRAQRTSATLSLEVADTDALSRATQRAISTTRSLGGYLVTVTYGTSETGAASLVVKVPSDRVQDALARLSALGTITSQNVQIDDLQGSLDATNRRIAVLRNRIATITGQLDGNGLSATDRARLEATRQSLRDELAGSRQSAQAIRGEAAFATIQLELRTKAEAEVVPALPSRFDRAVDDAVDVLAIEGVVLLYALLVIAPLTLVGTALWAALRLLGRRGRDRLLEAS